MKLRTIINILISDSKSSSELDRKDARMYWPHRWPIILVYASYAVETTVVLASYQHNFHDFLGLRHRASLDCG